MFAELKDNYSEPFPPKVIGSGLSLQAAAREQIETIIGLFEEEVKAGRMLPRNPNDMYHHIEDWIVAHKDGQIVGCVSLVSYNAALCELRSLAVAPDHQGTGIGRQLVIALVDLAALRGYTQVLTLTRAAGLFEKAGFRRNDIANFPEKVRRDCHPCPFKHQCDEVALLFTIHSSSENIEGANNG